MNIQESLFETINLIKTVAPVMFVSLLISNLLFRLPQFKLVLKPIERLSRFANLKSGIAISSFIIHPILGISLLSQMYRNKIIDFREAVISVVVSTLPQSVRITILFLAPVSISILGFKLGLILVALEILSKLIVATMGIVVGKILLSYDGFCRENEFDYENFRFKEILLVFIRTIAIMSVSAFMVSLILKLDVIYERLNFLPKESFLIVVSGIASTTAGISVADSLLAKDAIDWKSALFSILVSRFFHIFVESFRVSMPIYTSFFGFNTGFKLLLVQTFCRCLSIALSILLLSAL